MRKSTPQLTQSRRTENPFKKGVSLSLICFLAFVLESTVHSVPNDDSDSLAQSTPADKEQSQSRPPKTITAFSIHTIESLALVENYVQEEDFDTAQEKLDEVWQNEADLSLSEKAEVKYMSSRIAHMQQHVEETISLLESVLEYRDNISYAKEEKVLLRLSELHLSKKQHAKAHGYLNEWLEIVQQPKAGELAFAGSLFVKIKSFDRAKKYLSRAIDLQQEKGVNVDPRWSKLLDYVEKQLNASQ